MSIGEILHAAHEVEVFLGGAGGVCCEAGAFFIQCAEADASFPALEEEAADAGDDETKGQDADESIWD